MYPDSEPIGHQDPALSAAVQRILTAAATQDQILTRDEASAEWKISTRTIDRAIAAGELRAYRVNRAVRIRRADLESWLSMEMAR